MIKKFRVALSGDFLNSRGEIGWGDIGLRRLQQDPAVEVSFLENRGPEIHPDQLVGIDALILLLPRITSTSLQQAPELKIIARFGVGYDNLQVDAITANGTLITLTRAAVRRSVATAALALILGISHRLLDKDRLTRTGRWADKLDFMGTGLTGKTMGYVGWGNTGSGLTELLQPFGMRHIAFDPWARPEVARASQVELVELDLLARQADFIVVMAALTDSSRGLLDRNFFGQMRSSAFLINVARGPIVVSQDLAAALNSNQIAGAAIDVFETEPVAADDPLLSAKNTLLSPHATSWTEETALAQGSSAVQAVLDVSAGIRPSEILNPLALEHPQLSHLRD